MFFVTSMDIAHFVTPEGEAIMRQLLSAQYAPPFKYETKRIPLNKNTFWIFSVTYF